MFILISRYLKPTDVVDRALENHMAFLQKYFDRGVFILSGRKIPREGGIIICRARNRDEVRAILAEDPFVIEGVAEYELVEFEPRAALPEYASLLEK